MTWTNIQQSDATITTGLQTREMKCRLRRTIVLHRKQEVSNEVVAISRGTIVSR